MGRVANVRFSVITPSAMRNYNLFNDSQTDGRQESMMRNLQEMNDLNQNLNEQHSPLAVGNEEYQLRPKRLSLNPLMVEENAQTID